jgi:hypothetical protein
MQIKPTKCTDKLVEGTTRLPYQSTTCISYNKNTYLVQQNTAITDHIPSRKVVSCINNYIISVVVLVALETKILKKVYYSLSSQI